MDWRGGGNWLQTLVAGKEEAHVRDNLADTSSKTAEEASGAFMLRYVS